MLTGYHYTTWKAWRRIQAEGLRPSVLKPDQVKDFGVPAAIWLYVNQQEGPSLFGLLIDRVIRHRSFHVVELMVAYAVGDALSEQLRVADPKGRRYELTHTGTFTDRPGYQNFGMTHWHKCEPIELLKDPVKPCRIMFGRDFIFGDSWADRAIAVRRQRRYAGLPARAARQKVKVGTR